MIQQLPEENIIKPATVKEEQIYILKPLYCTISGIIVNCLRK